MKGKPFNNPYCSILTNLSTTYPQAETLVSVAVIIPVFNRAQKMASSLESVLAQTFENLEIICIDDGSTDDTPMLLRHYQHTYPQKIRVYQQPHRGVSAARNTGIQNTKAQFIAFLDSDDIWLPTKIERQINAMILNKWDICQTQEIWIRNSKQVNPMKKHTKLSGNIFLASIELCIVSPSATMLRRSILDHVGLFDETMLACEDYDLWLRIALHYPIHLVDEPLIHKTGGHADQLSHQFWGMDRFRIYSLKKLCNHPLNHEQRTAVYATIIKKSKILCIGAKKRHAWKTWLSYIWTYWRYRYAQNNLINRY